MNPINWFLKFAVNVTQRSVNVLVVILILLTGSHLSPTSVRASNQPARRSNSPYPPSHLLLEQTEVLVAEFQVEPELDGVMLLSWVTDMEVDLIGFNLYRQNSSGENLELVNADGMILATQSGQTIGDRYSYPDYEAQPEETDAYWLQLVKGAGEPVFYGPAEMAVEWKRIYLPAVVHKG
jgi:hypothetical protein